MAKKGFKAMDSDMHVFEPADLWQRYIDKKYLDRAPKGLNRSFRDLGIELEGAKAVQHPPVLVQVLETIPHKSPSNLQAEFKHDCEARAIRKLPAAPSRSL